MRKKSITAKKDARETIVIPGDLAGCQALIKQLVGTVDEQSEKINSLEQTIEAKDLEINELIQRWFRKRSERYLGDPNQMTLDFGDGPDVSDAADGLADALEQAKTVVAEHERQLKQPQKTRNEQLPDHLPRREVTLDAAREVTVCETHGEKVLIGYDVIETLKFERPQLWVEVTRIPKYVCDHEPACGVSSPPRPVGLVEGNKYDVSVAAEIITGKYGYHLPIYRQQDYFAGSGWTPQRSTLLNIQKSAAELIKPFIESLKQQVLSTSVIGTDDTSVTLLLPPEIPAIDPDDPKSKRIHEVFTQARTEGKPSVTAKMWAYRSVETKLNIFDFTVSRHRDGPDAFLVDGDFTGVMLGDCYSGYTGISLRSDARITRAACLAHARRKVYEARELHPVLSNQFLALFQQLYDMEHRAKELSPEDRQTMRDREARPVWERMKELLEGDAVKSLLPKDKFAEALGYLRNHWDALLVYLDDGRVPIDNNDVEQLMRQVALGRKNWLFIGSVAAGDRAADLMTLVSSAVRNDLDVWAYVNDVLTQLLTSSADYASLRPDVWADAHPEHIRTYRTQERRDKADAQRLRRAHRLLNSQ